MPNLDMPLAELMTYAGTNPRPDDHAAYWDRALAELRGIDPQIELRPAAFVTPIAECFDLFFTGVRGARIHAKVLKPRDHVPGATPLRPALLHLHGYTCRASDWTGLLQFAATGFVTVALDVRGQAGDSDDVGGHTGNTQAGHIIRGLRGDPDDLLYRQVFLDCAQLIGLMGDMDEVDGQRIATWGASQGGGLSLAASALAPVARTVALYPFLCDYQRVWDMDLCERAYAELKDFFRWHDPTHARHGEWFERLGHIDVQHLADRIGGKVLMACGLADAICPPSTQFAAYNRITAPKSVEIYPDFGHEVLTGFDDKAYAFVGELLQL